MVERMLSMYEAPGSIPGISRAGFKTRPGIVRFNVWKRSNMSDGGGDVLRAVGREPVNRSEKSIAPAGALVSSCSFRLPTKGMSVKRQFQA